ncbi:MAG: SGNH/GDSL hydrolase family protein [bacterium]|nr:SGNH/GDSL hydrolase family protein [bacterium]
MINILLRIQHALLPFIPFLTILTFVLLISIVGLFFLHRQQKKQSKRDWRIILPANFLFLVMFLSLGLLIAEVYFRTMYDATDNLFFLQTSQRWWEKHVILNNATFRDTDFSGVKTRGTIRIGVLGDSYTIGQGIKNREDLFTEQLEQILSTPERPVEVYNMGRSGWTTRDEVTTLLSPPGAVAQYRFDVLILAYVPNDIRGALNLSLLPSEEEYKNIRTSPLLQPFFDHSMALEFLFFKALAYKDVLFADEEQVAQNAFDNSDAWEDHQKTLAFFSHAVPSLRTPTVVAFFPFLHHLKDETQDQMYSKVKNIFEKNNIPIINFLKIFRSSNETSLVVSESDAHPNERAHRIIAEEIASFLQKNNLLQPRQPALTSSDLSATPQILKGWPTISTIQLEGLGRRPLAGIGDVDTKDHAACRSDMQRISPLFPRNAPVSIRPIATSPAAPVFLEMKTSSGEKISMNLTILSEGEALPLTINLRTPDAIPLLHAAWQARLAKKGLWGRCTAEELSAAFRKE